MTSHRSPASLLPHVLAISLAPIVVTLGACSDSRDPITPTSPTISPEAQTYMNEALDIMQARSVVKTQVDWPAIRDGAFQRAGAAVTTADTYAALKWAVDELDPHSAFLTPQELASFQGRDPIDPTSVVFDGSTGPIGYVSSPTFIADEQNNPVEDGIRKYYEVIAEADQVGLCGWVVDLRRNGGGSMWPMIAGLGPILGEGVAGSFIDSDGVVSEWFYRDGGSGIDESFIVQVEDPYELVDADPAAAVLTGPGTGSSGEAVAVSFRGRPATVSFGTPTAGLTTANAGFPRSDGALLLLAVATMADRTGEVYGAELPPDHTVVGEDTGDPATDAALVAALEWVAGHGACQQVP